MGRFDLELAVETLGLKKGQRKINTENLMTIDRSVREKKSDDWKL